MEINLNISLYNISMEELKKSYNEITKQYIKKYRATEAGKETYNECLRRYYGKKKEDDEWRKNHNERCKIYNKLYREKKALERGEPPKPRGRPRKIITASQ